MKMTEAAEPFVTLAGSYLPPPHGWSASPAAVGASTMQVLVWVRGPELPDPWQQAGRPPGTTASIATARLAETFAASQEDFSQVLAYVRPFGIEPVADEEDRPTALAKGLLRLEGPAAGFERAFGVRLARYGEGKLSWLGRVGHVKIPASLRGIVLGVFGLDQRPIGRRGLEQRPRVAALLNLPTPPQVAQRYGFPNIQATGQCIALMQFGGGYQPADIADYFAQIGQAPPALQNVIVPGGANDPNDDDAEEVILDIDIAGSVAQGAQLVVYFAPHTEAGWIDAMETVVLDTVHDPQTISISWGAAELGTSNTLSWTAAGMSKMRQSFAKALLAGKTVLAACGDHGSDCRVGDRRAHVPYPAADEFVVACGGTTIADMTLPDSAEVAWSRGGGGISEVLQIPPYQRAIALPVNVNTGQRRRGVPDIAGYADPGFHFRRNGAWFPAKGTSLTAPLYAALMALLGAQLRQPISPALPIFYLFRERLFRDIDNAQSNNTSNSFNYAPGYYGGSGWDARTGLGVPKPAEFSLLFKKT